MKFRSNRWAECGRKLRHLDYLSAMRHAANVPDNETVVIYPCSYCDAMHVGHQRWRKKDKKRPRRTKTSQPKLVHDLAWRLARTERRIALVQARFANLTNPGENTISKYEQRLGDMRKHLACLQTQRCNRQQALEADSAAALNPALSIVIPPCDRHSHPNSNISTILKIQRRS